MASSSYAPFLITIKISKNYPKFLIFYPNKNYVIIASRGVTMDNKLNNIINGFFENTDAKNDEELNNQLQELMKKYNNGEIDYVNTAMDDAYELLEEAQNTKSKKKAKKLAEEAYLGCPDCFDALLYMVELEDSYIKKLELLEEGLEFEKDRLEEEKYFEKDNIGHFYGIFETRPYMRGLYTKANIFIEMGKIKQARYICKEILKLNKNDNLGARYLLMAIYAFLEDEKEMLALYKKYPEEHLQMLFPLFALYYKNSNDEKAIEYLKRINKSNPNFLKFFKGKMEDNENIMPGYYSIGDSSEIKMYFMNYTFLLLTLPLIDEYILKYSKK